MSIDYQNRGVPPTDSSGLGGTDRDAQWIEWYKVGSVWHNRYHSGKPPKGSTKRGDGWVVPRDPVASTSTSTSTGTKTAPDPYNEKTPPRNGRAPYYTPERFFDSVTNSWRWRWRYSATNAETMARREGLHHDTQGYYRAQNGRRVYQTGRTSTGRRFHYERHDGLRRRVWDDPYKWPSEFKARRRKLQDERAQLKERLASLREQYRKARADQHVLKRNIMRRVHQIEASVERVTASLKRIPSKNPYLLDFSKDKPKLKAGIRVTMDYAEDPQDDKAPLSFTPVGNVGRGVVVWLRATISVEGRDWKPGTLGAPEMVRVQWSAPKGWLAMGNYRGAGTDEYFVSNPLYMVRPYKSPSDGNSHKPTFSVMARVYEFSFDSIPGANPEPLP